MYFEELYLDSIYGCVFWNRDALLLYLYFGERIVMRVVLEEIKFVKWADNGYEGNVNDFVLDDFCAIGSLFEICDTSSEDTPPSSLVRCESPDDHIQQVIYVLASTYLSKCLVQPTFHSSKSLRLKSISPYLLSSYIFISIINCPYIKSEYPIVRITV